MDGLQYGGYGHRLGPRIPAPGMEQPAQLRTRTISTASGSWSRLIARSSCKSGDSSSLCEKPSSGATVTTVLIVLAVVVPIAVALGVLLYLHRRTTARQRKEDELDADKALDYGMDITPGGKSKKKNMFGKEKDLGLGAPHSKQLSMDMNLSSPYLLPPGLQQSRESLHSLARTLHQNEDPYRPVAQYTGSDVGSVRSFPKGSQDRSSTYTGTTTPSNGRSMSTKSSTILPPRQNSLPPPPMPVATASPVQGSFNFEVPASTPEVKPSAPAKNPFNHPNETLNSGIAAAQFPEANYDAPLGDLPKIPQIQEPAPVARKGLPQNPRPSSDDSAKEDQSYIAGLVSARDSDIIPPSRSPGLGITDPALNQPSARVSPPAGSALPASPRPPRKASLPAEPSHASVEYYDGSENFHEQDQFGYEDRGRPVQGHDAIHEEYPLSAGLGVPAGDNRRLSVGFRPLPPDDYLESEDPEFRANRIRSFYKEYFDDKAPAPPMPQRAEFGYEDYGASDNYLGDAAFFDPDTNAFVMPYAQPVTRRAMTPPPNSRKPMGRPGPRGPGGPPSFMGGRPMPGGPGGRPRAGSTMSGRQWGPRPGSAASSQYGPRAGSSMSGYGRQPPKKKLPPPAALSTLPTPSKLKDDSFAIFNAADFAPPPNFKDQAAGRSQSPLGERKPYQVTVPAHSPLVSAFDDTPALPSPHLLRKSATFTALDFAPPRRFQDPENMSDAGSIRSNRSGISARNLGAIRNGAGRVSRLPGDSVFAAAALQDQLKPSWNMREAVDK